MSDTTTWIGLDVHEDSITAAILRGDQSRAEVVRLASDFNEICKRFRRFSVRGPIRSCFEASRSGFGLHRTLTDHGYSCEVVAPSLISRKPGDRRKTDRIDAIALAKLLRSGHLTPVEVPTEEKEAIRGLVRYRLVLER